VVDNEGLRLEMVREGLKLVFGIRVIAWDVLGETIGELSEIKLGQVTFDAIFGQGEGMRFGGWLGGRGRATGNFDGDLGGFTAEVDGLQVNTVGHVRAEFRWGGRHGEREGCR